MHSRQPPGRAAPARLGWGWAEGGMKPGGLIYHPALPLTKGSRVDPRADHPGPAPVKPRLGLI